MGFLQAFSCILINLDHGPALKYDKSVNLQTIAPQQISWWDYGDMLYATHSASEPVTIAWRVSW